MIVLDELKLQEIKTRAVVELLGKFELVDKKVLFVMDELSEVFKKSVRNIEKVAYTRFDSLHTYALLWADKVIVTKKTIEKIEEALA